MAFLLAEGAELVLGAVETGAISSFGNAIINQFKKPVENIISDETGKLAGSYAAKNKGGIVDKTIDKAYFYKKRPYHHHKKKVRKVG